MIPDFISAIYLWVADKISGHYPVWRSWLVPVCLFILFVGLSVLFIKANEAPKGDPTSFIEFSTTVEEVVEIENLKARLTAVEANKVILTKTINELVAAVNRIKAPPSLGNLATKSELHLLRLEIATWQKKLDDAELIHDRALTTLLLELDELKRAVEELEAAVTIHTDNATIHREWND